MTSSALARRLRWIAVGLAVTACGLEGIDPDAIVEPPQSSEGGGPGSGGRARPSGGNGLERPRGSSGRNAGIGGTQQSSGASGVSGGEGGASPSGGAFGGTHSAGKSSAPTGKAGSGGNGGVDAGGTGGSSAAALAGGATDAVPEEPPPSMFFSEYVEGTSNNKALELRASSDGSMNGCAIEIYLNGATSPRTAELEGRILAARPFVVCERKFSDPARCDAMATLSFNGNDAVALVCGGELMDVIGRIGEAPEDRWGTEAIGTLDLSLRRNCDVQHGDRDAADAYDPAGEWTAAGKDAFDGLGSHCVEEPARGGAGGGAAAD